MSTPIFVFDDKVVFSNLLESEHDMLDMYLPTEGMYNEMGWMCPVGWPSLSIITALRNGNMDGLAKSGAVLHIDSDAVCRIWVCQSGKFSDGQEMFSLTSPVLPYCRGFRLAYALYSDQNSSARMAWQTAQTVEDVAKNYSAITSISSPDWSVASISDIAAEVTRRKLFVKPKVTELAREKFRNTGGAGPFGLEETKRKLHISLTD